MQRSLLDPAIQLRSKVITKRGDFSRLFEGFASARAITYVASPDVLLGALEAPGFEKLELVLGDSLQAVSLNRSARWALTWLTGSRGSSRTAG